MPSSLWGVSLALTGSSFEALGLITQKLSHAKALLSGDARRYVCRPLWLGGFGIFLLGNILDMVALGLAPQSVVAPLGAMSLLVNGIASPWILGEVFTKIDALSTLVIIGGILLIIFSATFHTEERELEELLDRYEQPGFIAYACTLALIILMFYLIVTKRIFHPPEHRVTRTMTLLAYPGIGASFASVTILTAKSSMELLVTSFGGSNQFDKPLSFLLVILTAICAVTQVHWINVSLQNTDALFHIPVFYCLWNILSITGGQLYFGELEQLNTRGAFMYGFGVLFLFVGVSLLSRRLSGKSPLNDAGNNGEMSDGEMTNMVPGELDFISTVDGP